MCRDCVVSAQFSRTGHVRHYQQEENPYMTKEEVLEFPGIVTELLPNATFRVKLA